MDNPRQIPSLILQSFLRKFRFPIIKSIIILFIIIFPFLTLAQNGSGIVGKVVASHDLDGSEELFTLTSNGTVWSNRIPNSKKGQGKWLSLGGNSLQQIAVDRNADGRLELFALGGDRAVWHIWQTSPNGGWGSWASLGGTSLQQITANRNADGRLELFALGGDRAVWHIWQTIPNGGWGSWASLGGTTLQQITVDRNADGRLELFALGGDRAVWHIWQTSPNGGWGSWSSLGGTSLQQITISRNADGRLELFALGGDRAVWHIWQTSLNGGWGSWSSLGGTTLQQITVDRNADGRLELFALGGDRAVWHIWQTSPNGGWGSWASLGGTDIRQIVVVNNMSGYLDAYALSGENTIWHIQSTSAAAKKIAWEYVGGNKGKTININEVINILPPVLEIQSIDPSTPLENKALQINFKLYNDDLARKTRFGWIQAELLDDNSKVKNIYSSKFSFQNLQVGNSITGSVVFLYMPLIEKGQIHLRYNIDTCCFINPFTGSKNQTLTKTVSEAYLDFGMKNFVDRDSDGIDDRVEDKLLERYRPYYKFSIAGGSESYRPTDILWYIERSEILTSGDENSSPIIENSTLQNQPSSVVFNSGGSNWFVKYGPSDIGTHGVRSEYRINPLEKVPWLPGLDNPGRKGADWDEVMSNGHVGLYGHVVPIRLINKDGVPQYDRFKIPNAADQGDTYYKIEYWQFFGFNDDHIGPAGEHEGDWITVQLLYDPVGDSIASVFYYEHGTKEIRFDMAKRTEVLFPTDPKFAENVVEYRGINYTDNAAEPAQNIHSVDMLDELVRFYQDPITLAYTHPVVYIENGSHEPWPINKYKYVGVPNHNGDDHEHTFLTKTPPNLGEVDYPLDSTPGAYEVLRFNGHWGARGDGPPGPVLHHEWTWYYNTKIPLPESKAFTN